MSMQGGNRPLPQEFTAGHQPHQQWQANPTHQDDYWFDACQKTWVHRENQHAVRPEQPQQHVQLPQIHLTTTYGHSVGNPQMGYGHEDRHANDGGAIEAMHDLPLTEEPLKCVHKDPPVKLQKENKSSNKPASKTKADGDQAIVKLEDQGNWSDGDTKLLLETLLGGESELYEKLMTNAKYVYQKVASTVFSYILNFKSMTGNGGGDPDIEELDNKIENAWTAGKDVRTLSGAMLKKWYMKGGGYDLFNEHNESSEGDASNDGFGSDNSGKKRLKRNLESWLPKL
ncbi:hypothetical protein DFH29DRAFT_879784 [Suillus ampliporus]|nr:hypothetical protein DFH29DRAFT_879784 [Suillus ampliporus]